jgi:hypothetical protein
MLGCCLLVTTVTLLEPFDILLRVTLPSDLLTEDYEDLNTDQEVVVSSARRGHHHRHHVVPVPSASLDIAPVRSTPTAPPLPTASPAPLARGTSQQLNC